MRRAVDNIGILFAATVLVSGCAIVSGTDQTPGFFDNPRAFVRADVTAALERNRKANPAVDPGAPYRADCYAELLRWIPDAPVVPGQPDLPVGLVDAYELAAQKHATVGEGGLIAIPEAVKARCRYIEDELKRAALRGALKLAPIPGAGAGSILLR